MFVVTIVMFNYWKSKKSTPSVQLPRDKDESICFVIAVLLIVEYKCSWALVPNWREVKPMYDMSATLKQVS